MYLKLSAYDLLYPCCPHIICTTCAQENLIPGPVQCPVCAEENCQYAHIIERNDIKQQVDKFKQKSGGRFVEPYLYTYKEAIEFYKSNPPPINSSPQVISEALETPSIY